MKKTSNLYQLIKSLSKSEKRHFKLLASIQKGDKVYLKLFNIFDSQTSYDEENIHSLFAKEKVTKQLSPYKNYLYKLILKSLNLYHHSSSVEKKIRETLNIIDILYKKGLHTQCYKLLVKTKQIAKQYELYIQLIEILYWEEKLLKHVSLYKFSEKYIDELFNDMELVLKKINNNNQYLKLTARIFSFHYKNFSYRNQLHRKQIQTLMANPLLKNEDEAMSFNAKCGFYAIHSLYGLMKENIEEQYNNDKKLLMLIEEKDAKTPDIQARLVSAQMNLVMSQTALKKYPEALSIIAKIKLVKAKAAYLEENIFYFTHGFKLYIYQKTGEFKKGFDLINQIEPELQNLKNTTDELSKVSLFHCIAQLYFVANDYNKTLEWLNKLFNETNLELREDIHAASRILNLIVHYELKNENLVEYLVKSTYRFHYKRKRLYKFEIAMLTFIRVKLPKIITQKQLIKSFKNLKKELEEISKDPLEKWPLDEFNFINWLESKIKHKSLAEILLSKES